MNHSRATLGRIWSNLYLF